MWLAGLCKGRKSKSKSEEVSRFTCKSCKGDIHVPEQADEAGVEGGIEVVEHEGRAYHYGCHPCLMCEAPVTKKRCIRLYTSYSNNRDGPGKVPWDCKCLGEIDPNFRSLITTNEIVFTIEQKGGARDPELAEMLEECVGIIDLQRVLDTMNYYRVLSKNYSVRDMAKIYDLRLVVLQELNGTHRKGGGWKDYPNRLGGKK